MGSFKRIAAAVAVAASMCLVNVARADDLEKIQSAGKLSVAMSGVFPPFSFVDDNNKVVGFDVDIASEIARRLKVEPEIITTQWDGIIAGLLTKRYDTIIGSMTINEERKKAVDFVGPYYRSGIGVFVKKGSSSTKLSDLDGKTVGATLGEVSEKWARDQKKFDVRTYKGLPELMLELNSGRVDAIVSDDVPVIVAIHKSGAAIEQIKDSSLPKYDIGIAIRKENPELAAAMQKALDDMMADGTYEAIAKKWIGMDIRN
ncbi:amino acid ABC transporter substrate-binding protein [Rhizobium altiplani]|uniref:Amino acid ABC transporter substrate-binding protein n=1 Tax=Rhizobium altiplani TaxID=1864509 RepID=A0A109J242_9HYPH|nr:MULTISPECIES: transporter substrate-binding domain-containing protein [Rhizobium]KWV40931.1 amino acid ABC transporter substrate-binding protein [Rhizobium altiplani]KWV48014.1 amino acid ABC transporter substrate-binding protein [Rhizobium altiplani]KWV48053.1 amino acid ABC transporter substrate-binding protein [Rhizobium altiplani]KWV54586.1 amino acid ABC transporter substrate-binding protein [Rhizobium altiplani]